MATENRWRARKIRAELSKLGIRACLATIYLASEACEVSGAILHASGGFFGRVGIAHNPGVCIEGGPPSVEAVAKNTEAILSADSMKLPTVDEHFLSFV